MLMPKGAVVVPHRVIYKGYVEEGEGQYPIKKTEDWVENLCDNNMTGKVQWAAWKGFVASSAWALIDIRIIRKITERKAQLARFAYYTVPLTGMAAGWMAGVEFAKIFMGRKNENAWLVGGIVPGGILGVWRRDVYKGARNALIFGLIGYAYQHSCNNNYTNSIMPHADNPNMPSFLGNNYNKDWSFWNINNREEYSTLHTDLNIYNKAPEPSWKKWEDEKE